MPNTGAEMIVVFLQTISDGDSFGDQISTSATCWCQDCTHSALNETLIFICSQQAAIIKTHLLGTTTFLLSLPVIEQTHEGTTAHVMLITQVAPLHKSIALKSHPPSDTSGLPVVLQSMTVKGKERRRGSLLGWTDTQHNLFQIYLFVFAWKWQLALL